MTVRHTPRHVSRRKPSEQAPTAPHVQRIGSHARADVRDNEYRPAQGSHTAGRDADSGCARDGRQSCAERWVSVPGPLRRVAVEASRAASAPVVGRRSARPGTAARPAAAVSSHRASSRVAPLPPPPQPPPPAPSPPPCRSPPPPPLRAPRPWPLSATVADATAAYIANADAVGRARCQGADATMGRRCHHKLCPPTATRHRQPGLPGLISVATADAAVAVDANISVSAACTAGAHCAAAPHHQHPR